jgi:hypothetical protein
VGTLRSSEIRVSGFGPKKRLNTQSSFWDAGLSGTVYPRGQVAGDPVVAHIHLSAAALALELFLSGN